VLENGQGLLSYFKPVLLYSLRYSVAQWLNPQKSDLAPPEIARREKPPKFSAQRAKIHHKSQ
jgi:hypothetical protein